MKNDLKLQYDMVSNMIKSHAQIIRTLLEQAKTITSLVEKIDGNSKENEELRKGFLTSIKVIYSITDKMINEVEKFQKQAESITEKINTPENSTK